MTTARTAIRGAYRKPPLWGLLTIATLVGLASLTIECAQTITNGTCIASDTSRVATNITQASCTHSCPTCTWTPNR